MKTLWAFEPFHQDTKRITGMNNVLRQLANIEEDVEIAFVVTRTEANLNLAFNIPKKDRFTTYPLNMIKQTLKKAKLHFADQKIHVIDFESVSTTKAVDKLLGLAAEKSAGLLGLFTHARKGYSRFLLGSFAETAIHRSSINLLILNPKTEVKEKIKKVFFASDFSPIAEKRLQVVIDQCQKLKASLTVFHHAEPIYKWSLDESNPEIHAYRKKVKGSQDFIESECKKAGVKVKVIITADFESTTELIFKSVEKVQSDLIVVCAQSGPVASFLGGSITRQVIRKSALPVLVLK